ncbi:hypothetical protein BGZ67_009866 [Mortierella alpina]|nr:hypothetical protein BGZ67_009866 [Mortierella alpina]
MATTARIVVLCDGTWAGSETKTETNILLLAEMMGIDKKLYYNSTAGEPIEHHNVENGITACYFPGAGHGGTFLEHLLNGATGNDLDDDCLKVYKYIVQHYTLRTPPPEIWMFGYSRGAYTVRRVAGMIYNCGILKRRKNGHPVTKNNNAELSEDEGDLCKLVYQIFCSNDPDDLPEAKSAFRARVSHDVPTPVKFMGLFDTVGSLGIPYINPDLGLAFHEFHDTKVSSVVEKVYHVVSIHDRLWGFEPCHVLPAKERTGPQFEIHERWFPGCHYDIGRLRFQVFRSAGAGGMLGNVLNAFSGEVKPNLVFADLTLKWMLEAIMKHSGNNLIPDIVTRINDLVTDMTAGVDTGNGDVYDNPLKYGPLGLVWEKLTGTFEKFEPSREDPDGDVIDAIATFRPIAEPLWRLAKFNFHVQDAIVRGARLNKLPFVDSTLGVLDDIFKHDPFNDAQNTAKALDVVLSSRPLKSEFKSIINFLVQTRDRRISDVHASVVRYDEETLGSKGTIGDVGMIKRPKDEGSYRSKTYENFKQYRNIMGCVE